MADRKKVIKELHDARWYLEDKEWSDKGASPHIDAINNALALLKEQEVKHRRLLSWLGKFCRHIDNGDAWLTDEENIAFFKEKMKQQFGWDTDLKDDLT